MRKSSLVYQCHSPGEGEYTNTLQYSHLPAAHWKSPLLLSCFLQSLNWQYLRIHTCTLSACIRVAGHEDRRSTLTPHCSSASDAWSDAELPQWCFCLLLPSLSLCFGKGSCAASQCDIKWQHLHPLLRSGERQDCEWTLTEFHKTKLFRVSQIPT